MCSENFGDRCIVIVQRTSGRRTIQASLNATDTSDDPIFESILTRGVRDKQFEMLSPITRLSMQY